MSGRSRGRTILVTDVIDLSVDFNTSNGRPKKEAEDG